MIPWSYENKNVSAPPKDAKAFVYLLEFADGKLYIGKKNLESTRRKKIAGKSRRQVVVSESNWRNYLSSSLEVKAKIKNGDVLVKREILKWCTSTAEATYWELYEQVTRHVLCDMHYLNKWISAKIFRCTDKES